MAKDKILLIGAGGHCKVVIDALLSSEEFVPAGIIDVKGKAGRDVLGVPVIGMDDDMPGLFRQGIRYAFITTGSVGDVRLRVRLCGLAVKAGFLFPNVIASDAKVSAHAVLGSGNFIAPGVRVNAGARVGDHCILNTASVIEHDCVLGDFAHISPGAVLCGSVVIGVGAHIGAAGVVLQGLSVGADAVVGAGSVVTRDVPAKTVVYGNPCKERRSNE
jgi:sugar O-acyltransferase (sialic acid O-acetyltransferase NeuD family)